MTSWNFDVFCVLGILALACVVHVTSFTADERLDQLDSQPNAFVHDYNNRVKRNENELMVETQSATEPETDVISEPEVTTPPYWMADLLLERWYGWEDYQTRKMYKDNPVKRPMVCYNNLTSDANGTAILHFICPMADQADEMVHCCGPPADQRCCDTALIDDVDKDDPSDGINEIDLATGIGIAAGFISSVTICMLLYCCCCQRRPEIHDGIKLMWVRRSFGKEINRLEQPTYNNHLAVISRSRTGSRTGSRSGSFTGNRNPSRTPSRGPSPSVSRRHSVEPSPRASRKHKSPTHEARGTDSRQYMKVPTDVTITLTTPSDENGPTDPLLHTEKHVQSL